MRPPARLLRSATCSVPRAFFGPIFQREVRALGRRGSPYWVRFGYALLLLSIVTLVFILVWDIEQGASQAYGRQMALEFLAPAMLTTVAVVQMSVLALIAPVLTAGAIADEKRMRTLSTLLTTPLTSRDLVIGKLAAGTVQLCVLALIPMPLLLALRVFGGVETESIVASLVLSLSLGLLGASLSLMFSIWHRRTPTIVFFAMCSTAVLVGAPWMAAGLYDYATKSGFLESVYYVLTPYAQMLVLNPEFIGSGSVAQARVYWLSSAGYNLAIASVVALFSMFMLRGVLRREAAGGGSQGAIARFLVPGVEPDSAARQATEREPREVGDAPIVWREIRQGVTASSNKTFAVACIGVLILLGLYAIMGIDHGGLTATIAIITALALAAQSALTTPSAISSERDAGNWSVLLTTPVTSRQVVLGKVAGALRRLWLLPALLLLHMALVIAAGRLHPVAALHTTVLLGGLVVMLSGTGIFLGMFFKRGITASVFNLSIPIVFYLGLPMLLSMVLLMIDYGYADDTQWAEYLIFLTNPYVLLTEATTAATSENGNYVFFLRYDLLGIYDIGVGRFTFYTLVCGLGTAFIGVVAMAVAIVGFNRFNGRTS